MCIKKITCSKDLNNRTTCIQILACSNLLFHLYWYYIILLKVFGIATKKTNKKTKTNYDAFEICAFSYPWFIVLTNKYVMQIQHSSNAAKLWSTVSLCIIIWQTPNEITYIGHICSCWITVSWLLWAVWLPSFLFH